MDINRLKFLSGIDEPVIPTLTVAVTENFTGIKDQHNAGFQHLAKHFGATDVNIHENGLYSDAVVTFAGKNREESVTQLAEFSLAWKKYSLDGNLLEGLKVTGTVNSSEFPPIKGMEGPFKYESGKVLYYSPSIGKYYDSKTDTYLDADDVEAHRNPRAPVKEESSVAPLEEKMSPAQIAKKEEIVKAMKKDKRKLQDEYGDDWEKVMYATATKQALGGADNTKENTQVAEAGNTNFFQDKDDGDNTVELRTGVKPMRGQKVKVPAEVKTGVAKRIAELKKSSEHYDDKGYNDESLKQKAIEVLEKIMDNLSSGDVEGLRQAQIYFATLMSPITDLLPANLVLFLANAMPVSEQKDPNDYNLKYKDRPNVIKGHIAHYTEYMGRLDKDSWQYKELGNIVKRLEKELAQYNSDDISVKEERDVKNQKFDYKDSRGIIKGHIEHYKNEMSSVEKDSWLYKKLEDIIRKLENELKAHSVKESVTSENLIENLKKIHATYPSDA